MITKAQKTEVIEANRTHEADTGSPEVQIAILTERIRQLTAEGYEGFRFGGQFYIAPQNYCPARFSVNHGAPIVFVFENVPGK